MGSFNADVQLADFNNDGKLDAITPDQNSGTVSVRLGNGDGTFGNRITSAATGPFQLDVGDLNGDMRLDLVTSSVSQNRIYVKLGQGDGTFVGATFYATGAYPYDPTLADINNDGKLDLLEKKAAKTSA